MCFNDRRFVQQAIQSTPEPKPATAVVELLRTIEQLQAEAQARNLDTLAHLLDMAILEAMSVIQSEERKGSADAE